MKPHFKNFLLYILAIIFSAAVVTLLFSKNPNQINVSDDKATSSADFQVGKYTSPPKMAIDINKNYQAKLVTVKGEISIDLFVKEVPNTVNNFVFLARDGFYDGTKFHRIVKDFMIQGGDPRGDGSGGPGYTFADEKITRDYKRGIVAMANRGPNTNGSQFFIMHQDYNLPKNYVIFGSVTQGLDTLDKIAETATVDNGFGEKSKPTEEVRIEKVTIIEK